MRYIHDRFLPDKAIDLVDEAAAGLRLGGGRGKVLREADIARTVSAWTSIPVAGLSQDESRRLRDLEGLLRRLGVTPPPLRAPPPS